MTRVTLALLAAKVGGAWRTTTPSEGPRAWRARPTWRLKASCGGVGGKGTRETLMIYTLVLYTHK